jgi:type VI secretion system VgrG family protein
MINFQFVSEALPEDTFQVLQFDAEEEVSQLFHVELRLVSRDPNIDFDLMLKRAACLSIITEGKQRNIHGMLAEFEQGGEWQNGLYEYRALLVPRLWMLSQSTQNQIFQDQTVLDIVASELKNVNKKGSNPLAEAGLGSDADYEAFTIRRYEEREYVVQYKETDLNFISRLMEHEGIYYYFEHNDDCEKLVITDTFAEEYISDNSEALFQSEASGVRYDNRVVYKLSRLQKQIPSSVLVKDFNYRSPSLPMQAMGDIDESGIGFVTEFGAHFKSPEEGEALATVRAEEFKCRQNTYSGESNISDFCCGHVYSLSQHFRSDYNQSYMLTKVKHQGSQEIESWGNIGSTKYSNQFDCIPALLQFRPQRLAVKPRLFGIMNGVIDSEQDLGRADLDEQGRYKVQMPFDISGVAPGLASRRIRMAQPYGGSGDDGGGTGMSFPLLKGTEVIWTCIDGDIDRPIITGAVPNPLKPSVTNTQNANSNVIKTTSGITMGFHDGLGGGAGQGAAGGDGSLAAQQQNQSINFNQYAKGPEHWASSTLKNNSIQYSFSQQGLTQQQQMMAVKLDLAGATLANSSQVGTGKQWSVVVPDYDDITGVDTPGSNDSYLRLGKSKGLTSSDGLVDVNENLFSKDGWLDFTDGDHVTIANGNRVIRTAGNTDSVAISSYKYDVAASTSYAIGAKNLHSLGVSTSSSGGLAVSSNFGINIAFKYATDFTFSHSRSYSYISGNSYQSAGGITQVGQEAVWLKVEPSEAAKTQKDEEKIKALTKKLSIAMAVGSTAMAAAITVEGKNRSDTKPVNRAADLQTGLMMAAGVATAAAAYSAGRKIDKEKKKKEKEPVSTGTASSELYMNEKVAMLKSRGKDSSGSKVELIAALNKGDKKQTVVRLNRGKDKERSIVLIAGEALESKIKLGGKTKEDGIVLQAGKTSITMKDDSIVIKCAGETFTFDEKGLTLKDKDITISKGSLTAKKKVEAKDIKATVSVKSPKGDVGGIKT